MFPKVTQLTFFLSNNRLICFDESRRKITFSLSLSALHSDAVGCKTLTSNAPDWLLIACEERGTSVLRRNIFSQKIFFLEVEKGGVSTIRRARHKLSRTFQPTIFKIILTPWLEPVPNRTSFIQNAVDYMNLFSER